MNGKHVLLVEDESLLLEMICEALEAKGYQVATASNAVGALSLLGEQTRFDHVISDVIMPEGMSGIELAHRVAELQPQARITLVSGISRAQLPPLPDGVSFLPKPYRLGQLLDELAA